METKYPIFKDGEVLTSERLNGMVDYLQGETKLSRSCLFGYGIVEGLTYVCDEKKGELTIAPGVAVTPNGDLIAIKEAMTFSDSTKGLATAKQSLSQKQLGRLSDNLLLALEIYEEKQEVVCNQRSCNVNHSGVVRKVRFRLIEKGQVGKSSRKLVPIGISLELERLTDIHTALNYDVLMKKIHGVFETNRDRVVKSMETICKLLGIKTKSAPNQNQSFDSANSEFTLESLIAGWSSKVNEYVGALTNISKLNKRGGGSVVVPPYYLLFLEDMRKALLEFVEFYNEFADKYQRNLLLPHEPYNGNMVVLGAASSPNGETDGYRDYFRHKNPDPQYVADCGVLDKLFTRILKMSGSFIRGKYLNLDAVQIIPEFSSPKLGDKVIPFYYSAGKDLRDCWGVNRLSSAKVYGSEDFKEAKVADNPYNLVMDGVAGYSLQGGYYKNCENVKTLAERIIDKYNLPIEVEVLEVSNIKLSKNEAKGYYCKLKRYVSDSKTEKIVNSFDIKTNENSNKESFSHFKQTDATYEKEKMKYEKDKMDTMNTTYYLRRVFKERPSFCNFMERGIEKKPVQKSKEMESLISSLKELTPHRIKMFYKYAFTSAYGIKNRFSPRRESVSMYKRYFWTIRPIAAVSQIRDYAMRTYRPKYRNAEFGMVQKYGKLVLVSYKKKLVMDFFLPN